MLIRFAVHQRDPDSLVPGGVIQVLDDLREDGALAPYEDERAAEIMRWLSKNLPEPTRFDRSRSRAGAGRGISWLRHTARAHIRRMHELCAILEDHDVTIRMLTTDRPGRIVYEDEYQVVAEPFADTSV
jgi:hypothetical protein